MSALATSRRAMDTLFDPDGGDVWVARTLVDAPPAPGAAEDVTCAGGSAEMRPGASGGGPMLDDLLASMWEGLAAHRVVACPVCAADMHPEYGAHALPLGGRCRECGSTLT